MSFFFSCAYFTREPGRPPKINGIPISDEKRLVYVQNFRNNSYGPTLHTMLTRLVKEEINARGRFIQTRDKSNAQYRIYGEIAHYQLVGNIVDQAGQHISREMLVVVRLEIQKAGGEKLVLERNEIPGRVYYSEQIGFMETEEQAQTRLLRNLAIRIAEEAENAWYFSLTGVDEGENEKESGTDTKKPKSRSKNSESEPKPDKLKNDKKP